MKPVVKFVITDVHMGLGHDGLNEVIKHYKKKNQLFAKTLSLGGGLILFLNTSRTRAKMFMENGSVIGYLRVPTGKLTERSLSIIPETFGGSVEFSKAAKKGLESFFRMEADVKKEERTERTRLYAR